MKVDKPKMVQRASGTWVCSGKCFIDPHMYRWFIAVGKGETPKKAWSNWQVAAEKQYKLWVCRPHNIYF